jgi:CDP-glucose 4,6-dehydratase
MVIASTDKVYGEANVLPYTEETELKAHGPYDTSKACMDLMCQSFAATYNLPITILRAGNIYGPGDLNWDRIIPGVCKWLLQKEQSVLRSNGEMIRDYIYVEDVALAYLYAGAPRKRTNNLNIYNVSINNAMKVIELYEKLCLLLVNRHVAPLVQEGNIPEITEQRLDSSLIFKQLGWKPFFTSEESLLKTISWYREVLHAPYK